MGAGLWFLVGGFIGLASIMAIGISVLLRRWCKSYALPKRPGTAQWHFMFNIRN